MPLCHRHVHAYTNVCPFCVLEKPGQRNYPQPAGQRSNAIITQRNGGVRPLFVDSIGGDSSNYK